MGPRGIVAALLGLVAAWFCYFVRPITMPSEAIVEAPQCRSENSSQSWHLNIHSESNGA